MDIIQNTLEINWSLFILTLCTTAFCIKEVLEILTYLKKKFRIKTGSDLDKETVESRIFKLEAHDKWQYDEISKISKGVDEIKGTLEQKDIRDKEETVAMLRIQLYDLHVKFMEKKCIDKSGLKTFLELGRIYERAGGDDIYHDKLKPEIMKLRIQGEDE